MHEWKPLTKITGLSIRVIPKPIWFGVLCHLSGNGEKILSPNVQQIVLYASIVSDAKAIQV